MLARKIWSLLAFCTLAPAAAHATADLTTHHLPACAINDGATEMAVLCAIANGYPNNTYSIKGTFSPGELPYYGVTYNPASTLWVGQIGSWDSAQRRIQTDARGAWRGYLYLRLERDAPDGPMLFRFSAVPLKPVSLPGPTVSPWLPMAAVAGHNSGWLAGHVFQDAACSIPAQEVIVQAEDSFGRILAAYASQDTHTLDGEEPMDHGYVRLGVPIGTVARLTGRTSRGGLMGPAGTLVPVYTRSRGPWRIRAGQTVSFDAPARGDVDGDGALTVADAALLARMAAGLELAPPERVAVGDVFPDAPDGAITLTDAATLLLWLIASAG